MSLTSCSSDDFSEKDKATSRWDGSSKSRKLTDRLKRLGLLLLAPTSDIGISSAFLIIFYYILSQVYQILDELSSFLWLGIPDHCPLFYRSDSWRIVLVTCYSFNDLQGYLSCVKSERSDLLSQKRKGYFNMCSKYYYKDNFSDHEMNILKQIRVDLPRTNPSFKIFKYKRLQDCMERILFVWSCLNPDSGYVQGINDLLTLFVIVFLRPYINKFNISIDDISLLSDDSLSEIEADSFFCLSRILSELIENYTENQPGVYRSLKRLCDLVKRIDYELYKHLEDLNVDFMQFPFRWMNCMLIREIPTDCSIRLWDTYISEIRNGMVTFHEYVSVAFLCYWSEQLRSMDYQHCLLFLQQLPTSNWCIKDIDTLIAKAYQIYIFT
uniref:Rab-GTPase-TBC domain containing protein, putative n=1 Tax=Theileria annulata TaxID=5874 RepID=A0A3B0MX76_THEAN